MFQHKSSRKKTFNTQHTTFIVGGGARHTKIIRDPTEPLFSFNYIFLNILKYMNIIIMIFNI